MSVQKVTHEVRLEKWRNIVMACRNSGKTIKTWCSENNINVKTYYHWQKLVRTLGDVPKDIRGRSLFKDISKDIRGRSLFVNFQYNILKTQR